MSLRKLTFQSFISLILLSILQNPCLAAFDSGFFSATSSDGVVPIQKDSNGFYVNADIGRPSTPSKQTQNDTTKMMLLLMTEQTMLASNCLRFSPYDCNSYQCSLVQVFYDIDYPWFTTKYQLAKAFVSLDSSYWTLNNYAFFTYQCGGNNGNIGTGRSGAIGLGRGDTTANFLKEVLFSMWIDQNLENGILLFGSDTGKYAGSEEISRFSAGQDWSIDARGGSIQIGTKSFNFNGVLSFDINSDIPGFDTNTFSLIINYLKGYSPESQVTCDSSNYKPVCSYTGSFAFPDLKIMTKSNAAFPISADLIYLNKTNSSFTLNMKLLSHNLNNANYITPSYDGTIVLNAQIMSHFYIVFNGTNKTIHLYNANMNPGTSSEWVYILIFTLIGFIFIGALAFFARKAMKKSDEQMDGNHMHRSPLLNTENPSHNTSYQVFSEFPNKKITEKN